MMKTLIFVEISAKFLYVSIISMILDSWYDALFATKKMNFLFSWTCISLYLWQLCPINYEGLQKYCIYLFRVLVVILGNLVSILGNYNIIYSTFSEYMRGYRRTSLIFFTRKITMGFNFPRNFLLLWKQIPSFSYIIL